MTDTSAAPVLRVPGLIARCPLCGGQVWARVIEYDQRTTRVLEVEAYCHAALELDYDKDEEDDRHQFTDQWAVMQEWVENWARTQRLELKIAPKEPE